jgi:flagellar basal-body rod modification protein FlgD
VSVRLVDAKGRLVRTLASGLRNAGTHEETWDGLTDDGLPAPSGIYFVSVIVNSGGRIFSRSGKMLLCR